MIVFNNVFNIFLSETHFQAIGSIPLAKYKINSSKLAETASGKCFEINLVMKLPQKKSKMLFMYLKNVLTFPPDVYWFKVNNENTRTMCEICSKLTIKISQILVFLLLTLNK